VNPAVLDSQEPLGCQSSRLPRCRALIPLLAPTRAEGGEVLLGATPSLETIVKKPTGHLREAKAHCRSAMAHGVRGKGDVSFGATDVGSMLVMCVIDGQLLRRAVDCLVDGQDVASMSDKHD
jgi:hypothetical protein